MMVLAMGIRFKFGGRSSGRASKPASFIGKLFTTTFLSIFVVAGGFFASMMVGELQHGIDQQGWVERPCTVIDSGVSITASSNDPYMPWVEYTYTHGGKTYTSSNVSDDDAATNIYREAQACTIDYPKGGTGKAFINPNKPSESVLSTSGGKSLMTIGFLAIWLPLFSGIPLAIIIATWWPKKKDKAAERRITKDKSGTIAGVLFGGVFAAAGLGMLIFMTILPLTRTALAQNWNKVSCDIERSEILQSQGDDGPTYRIDILYFYQVNGQRYGCNRYSFASIGSSSGYDGKLKVTQRYPVGQATTCYVDPNDPTHAVLVRGLTLANLWGLFPLPFLTAGLAAMYFSLPGKETSKNAWHPQRRKRTVKQEQWAEETNIDDNEPRPVILKPTRSRLGKFAGLTFVALFWNGIVSVFIYQVAKGYLNGAPETLLTIFLIPFVIVGLGIIFGAIRQLMMIFAPSVVIELDRRALPIGGSTMLRWHMTGGSGRVKSVTIALVGEESATYTRGTDTATDTDTFFEQYLVGDGEEASEDASTSLAPLINRGDALLQVPQDTMHSFEAENNKIVWKLRVRSKVAGWPDPKDEYRLTVLPMRVDSFH